MSSSQGKQTAQIVRLDPTFVLVTQKIWLLIKLGVRAVSATFGLVTTLVRKLSGRATVSESASSAGEQGALVPTSIIDKSEGFLSHGALRWHSAYTPSALRKLNLRNYPEGTAIKFELWNGAEKSSAEVAVYGDLYEEQLINIESSIDKILSVGKIRTLTLKEIHAVKDLGRFLNSGGIPENEIRGFTIDALGAVLVHEEILLHPGLCFKFFDKILDEERNFQEIRAKAGETLWNISQSIAERVSQYPEFLGPDPKRKYGSLRSKHIIDADTPIAGGLYLGLPAREAIYVNPESDKLNLIFKSTLSEIRKLKAPLGPALEEQVLRTVASAVKKAFPHHSTKAVIDLRQKHRVAVDQDLDLDFFLNHETGDAEHFALLAGYILERLHKEHESYLSGTVSVDRNWLPGGGHAWVRYTHSLKDVYILDAFKDFCGRLDSFDKLRWPYERKEDLKRERVARPF